MNAVPAPDEELSSKLDNLTLSRKEGWRDFTAAPKRTAPELLSRAQIRRLSQAAADIYKQRRDDWHNNLGPFKTPQLAALHEDLWDVIDSNVQDGNHAKGAVALDGYPGLGKTTAVEAFGSEFHLREIRRHGEFTHAGDERWPVCRIGMRGNTSMKDFNRAMCEFYAHPGRRGSTEELGRRALDYVLQCETRLLIIDDLHFLHWQQHGGIEINNHFKYITNDFPLTLVSIGIGLLERGVLMDDASYEEVLAQTSRRTTVLEMTPYSLDTERQRRDWRTLLTTIEQRLVLGQQTHWHARRRSLRLPVRPQLGTHRVTDGANPPGMHPRHPHRLRDAEPQATGHDQNRQRGGEGTQRARGSVSGPENAPPNCNRRSTWPRGWSARFPCGWRRSPAKPSTRGWRPPPTTMVSPGPNCAPPSARPCPRPATPIRGWAGSPTSRPAPSASPPGSMPQRCAR